MTDTTKTYSPSPEYLELISKRKAAAARLGVSTAIRQAIVKSRTPYRDEFQDRPADPLEKRFEVRGVLN